ncbi:MAG: hypothetical protein AAF681_14340, partial [Pseudomonadota bacterium]
MIRTKRTVPGAVALSAVAITEIAMIMLLVSGLSLSANKVEAQVNVSRCYAYFGGSSDIMVANNPRSNQQCVSAIRACATDRSLGGWTANWGSSAKL